MSTNIYEQFKRISALADSNPKLTRRRALTVAGVSFFGVTAACLGSVDSPSAPAATATPTSEPSTPAAEPSMPIEFVQIWGDMALPVQDVSEEYFFQNYTGPHILIIKPEEGEQDKMLVDDCIAAYANFAIGNNCTVNGNLKGLSQDGYPQIVANIKAGEVIVRRDIFIGIVYGNYDGVIRPVPGLDQ